MPKITMSKQTNLTIEEAFEQFIRKCRINNLSPETILDYRTKISRFYDFVDETAPISTVTADTVDEFILALRDEEVKDVTINSYLRSIRAFLYYCMDCDYIAPSFKITIPKCEKNQRDIHRRGTQTTSQSAG